MYHQIYNLLLCLALLKPECARWNKRSNRKGFGVRDMHVLIPLDSQQLTSFRASSAGWPPWPEQTGVVRPEQKEGKTSQPLYRVTDRPSWLRRMGIYKASHTLVEGK